MENSLSCYGNQVGSLCLSKVEEDWEKNQTSFLPNQNEGVKINGQSF